MKQAPPRKIYVCLTIIGLIAIVLIVITFMMGNREKWSECEYRGGHMYARGNTTICLDKDGRVIEI